NIKILNNTFKNLRDWHMVEINACQNVYIENNLFSDYGTSTMGSEMLQIDLSVGEHAFPWLPPFDDTTCDNIKIFNNKFINGVRGIGTHSSKDRKEHIKIFIENNEFINMSKEAIHGLNWAFTRIKNNHFVNVFKGIYLTVKG